MIRELFWQSLKFFGIFVYYRSNRRKASYHQCQVFCLTAVGSAVVAALLLHAYFEYISPTYANLAFKKAIVHLYSNIVECLFTAIFYIVCISRVFLVENKLLQIRVLMVKVVRNLQIRNLSIVTKTQTSFFILFYTIWILVSLFEVSIRVKFFGAFVLIHLFKHYAQLYLCLCAFTFAIIVLTIYRSFQLLNKKLNNILKQNNKKKTDVLALDTLSKTHWYLCESMSTLEEAFGPQLLVILFYVYIKCITHMYRFISLIFIIKTNGLQYSFFLIHFSWIFCYFSLAVIVFKSCTDTTTEARKTNVIIWDNVDLHQNLPLAGKLKTFSIKLNHDNYKFTACGFFVLQLSTLSSMILSVMTQLVILFSIFREI